MQDAIIQCDDVPFVALPQPASENLTKKYIEIYYNTIPKHTLDNTQLR
jgi:hypothetical protein